MSANVYDRRYRRTERALHQAVRALIRERGFATLTVDDITARAGIARKTLYAHYEHKEALLWATMDALFDEIIEAMGEIDPDTLLADRKPLTYPLFVHVNEYAIFYREMLSDSGSAWFIHRLWTKVAQVSFSKHSPLRAAAPLMTIAPDLMAELLAGAALGAVRWWLQAENPPPPEAMAYTFSMVMAPGVLASMGMDAV